MANGSIVNDKASGRNPWLMSAVVLLVLVVAIGSYMQSKPRRIRISVTHPERQEITSSITTNGKVEPIHNFEAHAPASISVKQVYVKPGEFVHKGQLLLSLNDGDAKERLARAEAYLRATETSLTNLQRGGSRGELLTRANDLNKATEDRKAAERNLDALTRLQQKGAASPEEVAAARDRLSRIKADEEYLQKTAPARFTQQDLARAQSDRASAEAAVESASQLMNAVEVRAPFDGNVYLLPVKNGTWVNAGETLLMMADLTQMQVRTFIDEPDIGRIQPNQSVRITWDALAGRAWQGKVLTVPTTVVNRGSRVVGEALCAIDNQDRSLLPGVDVNVSIVSLNRPNVLTVPREALHNDKGQTFVYVVRGSELQRRNVKTGAANLTRIEITDGLNGDETLGLSSLSPSPMSDGVSVRIVENQS